jgi:hypothetical protein
VGLRSPAPDAEHSQIPELSQVATVPVVVVLTQFPFDVIREREERGIPRELPASINRA